MAEEVPTIRESVSMGIIDTASLQAESTKLRITVDCVRVLADGWSERAHMHVHAPHVPDCGRCRVYREVSVVLLALLNHDGPH